MNVDTLVTLVHKNGKYRVYHKQSLYKEDGTIDVDFKHSK